MLNISQKKKMVIMMLLATRDQEGPRKVDVDKSDGNGVPPLIYGWNIFSSFLQILKK